MLIKDRYPCSRWDSNPQSQQARGCSPPGHWDRWSIAPTHRKWKLILWPLKGLFSEIDRFNKKSRTLLLRPLISFVVSGTQSVIECNAEMKQIHPTHLTQGPIAHRYFWEGGQARFPALYFSPHSTYSRWDSLLWQYLSCRRIWPPLNSGLMTVYSQPGLFSSLPSFFNHEWQTEKRHECANMGKVKRLELWWQLYVTWLPEQDVRNIRPMDFCSTECT